MNRVLSIVGRRVLVTGATVLCGIAGQARAQVAEPRDRWALGLAGDVGAVPEAMSTQCGLTSETPVPMLGAGVSVVFAPRAWLIVSSDSRISGSPGEGCKLTIPAPNSLGDGRSEYLSRDYRNMPTIPLMRSAVRVGVQTPRGLPLLRATVGGGLLWASTPAPFGAVTAGIGSRGEHVRFYGEMEGAVARVRVADMRTVYHASPSGAPVVESQTTTPAITHPHWVMAHIGIELPFASR